MENRLQRRSIVTVLLVTVLAIIAGISVLFACLNAIADEGGQANEQGPAATIYLGIERLNDNESNTYYYDSFERGWEAGVNRAATAYAANSKSYVKVILEKDWIADHSEGFGTGEHFSAGRIFLKNSANIVLDLKGHKIDRALTEGVASGQVMQISGGLTLEDSVGGGKITGGYNKLDGSVYGGGVYVKGGTFTMNAGRIENNRAHGAAVFGVGVTVADGGTFILNAGTITNNSNTSDLNSYGGGVCVYSSGSFVMNNGTITNNAAVFGGGVACYEVSGSAITVNGGSIYNNRANCGNSGATHSGGGAICVYNQGGLTLNGGSITNNRTDGYGGAIYVYGSTQASNLHIAGGEINNNIASSIDGNAYGGGVAVRAGNSSASVVAEMTGGKITDNRVIANCENDTLPTGGESYKAIGGGLYIGGASFELKGGEIGTNESSSFMSDDTVGNLNNTCDGRRTYGGGVGVADSGSLIMSGGSIKNNRATTGGGLNVDGGLVMSGGNITDNEGANGGGLYLTENARVSLSGKPVIESNYNVRDNGSGSGNNRTPSNLYIDAADARRPKIVGAFDDEARIHVYVNESLIEEGLSFTQGYGENNRQFVSVDGKAANDKDDPTNGIWVYANPYRYFISDTVYSGNDEASEQHIMVLENGELGIARNSIKFVVTFLHRNNPSISTGEYIYGDANAQSPAWNYCLCIYGENEYAKSIAAYVDGEQVGEIFEVGSDAGVYTIKAKPGEGETAAVFSVVVKAKELTNSDVTVEPSKEDLVYDKTPKAPQSCKVTYKIKNEVLVKDVDYTLSYENNINAGKEAKVIVTFIGNYTGTASATFTIKPAKANGVTITVDWQAKVGEEWIDFNSKNAQKNTFYYDGTDQSGKIRAKITIVGAEEQPIIQTVYAKGVEGDELQNEEMFLEFSKGSAPVSAFMDASTSYGIILQGDFNYETPDFFFIQGIVMGKRELNISQDTVDDYVENNGVVTSRLWKLQIGTNNPSYSSLLDKPTYVVDGAGITGELIDSYARYRETELSLVLNEDYVIYGDMTVAQLLEISSQVKYSHEGDRVGTMGGQSKVVTTVTLTLGPNYNTGNADNTIVLTKEWYIITMSNELLNAGDGSSISSRELQGWTFGCKTSEVQGYAFRSEHGDTLFYSYYKLNEDGTAGSPAGQFALKYSNDTSRAYKLFYKVITGEDGEMIADLNSPLNDDNYLYTFNYGLKAGSYMLEVTVPQREAHTGPHAHWWDNNVIAEDNGAIYYKLVYNFTFKVGTYAISNKDGKANAGITWEFPENVTAEYNGEANNIVKPTIKLNGKLLVEGEDYTLSSESVNVGMAVLTVEGIDSLTGKFTIEDAYEIVMARNGWQIVPYIMHWTYSEFKKEVNLITASTYLLDDPSHLWYSITSDEKGTQAIKGLEHFTVDSNWQVPDDVAQILKGLSALTYYLCAHVDGNDNYYALETQIIPFTVFTANNSWEVTPTVNMWVEGRYNEKELDENGNEVKRIVVTPVFGKENVHIHIEDDNGKVIYDTDEGIDLLAEAKAGRYTLTAYVDGSADYTGLPQYTLIFSIFEKPGLPWWSVLLIVVGALGLAALVIFILWKNGVFRIVTDKILVAIRTRVSVEATIASVRAAKMMEEGRKSVEAAKRRDRADELHKKAEKDSLTPEESEELRALEEQIKADKANS